MRLSKENYRDAFSSLDRLLFDCRSLWSESAFVKDELSWQDSFPVLYRDLLALCDEALHALGDERELMLYLSDFIAELGPIAHWQIARLGQVRWQTPQRALFGLSERKKRQTEGFVSALSELWEQKNGQRIVDWCSGRGLLARQLHYASGSRVLCLERDPGLCESGRRANERMDRSMAGQVSFVVQDVLCSLEPAYLENSYLHTALHACGDLHISMLEQAVGARVPTLACSPCCYHLMECERYEGLSQEGRQALLKPTKNELRLATSQTCTANALEQELRQRELLWRTAFDLHLRKLTRVEAYTPTPSIKKSVLKTSFQHFVHTTIKNLQSQNRHPPLFTPPTKAQEDRLLERAERKLSKIKRLEKAQLGFRRVLEYWLLLDRVLFLQERGYEVQLKEFCDQRDSGRNILLLARLPG